MMAFADRGEGISRFRPAALALIAALLILLVMMLAGGRPALAQQGCGQRVKIDVHFLKTRYIYSASQKKISRLAGAPAWGLYVTSMKYSGQSVVRGDCVNVNLDVYVNSKIYVAKELKKNKCRFALVLAHEKTHRIDDRKSLRNLLRKRNALINKLGKGRVVDPEKFISYTIRQLDGMIGKYYSEFDRRSDNFHKDAKRSC